MFFWSLFCWIGVVPCGLWCFYPTSSKVLPLFNFILLMWSLFSDELFLLLGSFCSWFLLNCFRTTLAFLHMASYVCVPIASGGCRFSPWLWHMWDLSFQWLLDEFPASLVCHVPWSCLVPSFQGNVFLLWLISGGPVVGYASLAFVPHVSSGTMWGPYFCTSFHMDVLLRAAVTLVLGFFVCNRILDPF